MSESDVEQMLERVVSRWMARSSTPAPMPAAEPLVTITEAGALTHSSDKLIRRLLREQKVTRYGIGRSTRVKMSEVHAALRLEGAGNANEDAESWAARTARKRSS